jgi:hypothetical protein
MLVVTRHVSRCYEDVGGTAGGLGLTTVWSWGLGGSATRGGGGGCAIGDLGSEDIEEVRCSALNRVSR